MKYTAELFEIDGLLSYRRAEVLGGIVRSLTDQQKAVPGKMVFNNSATWPELQDQVDKRSMSHTAHVAVMTYASEMFSWYAGTVEADVYFCPERHATYFGSFYMKDIPAMGNPNYSISTSLTGDSGEAFLAALTEPQRKLVTGLVDQQRADLKEIVKTRRAIATELRRFMKEESVDKDKVMALSRRYGELDGEISYFYATAFAEVAKTLTADQKKTLLKLRNLDAKYTCKGAYLYSRADRDARDPEHGLPVRQVRATAPRQRGARRLRRPAARTRGRSCLRSPEVSRRRTTPKDYTGDGASATLPLEWSGAPAGTKSFAAHHAPHRRPKDRPSGTGFSTTSRPTTQSLPKNVTGVGTLGNNSVNGRTEYAPPHSKGPGPKTYIYTVYALSAPVKLDVPAGRGQPRRAAGRHEGQDPRHAELRVVYSRDVRKQGAIKP